MTLAFFIFFNDLLLFRIQIEFYMKIKVIMLLPSLYWLGRTASEDWFCLRRSIEDLSPLILFEPLRSCLLPGEKIAGLKSILSSYSLFLLMIARHFLMTCSTAIWWTDVRPPSSSSCRPLFESFFLLRSISFAITSCTAEIFEFFSWNINLLISLEISSLTFRTIDEAFLGGAAFYFSLLDFAFSFSEGFKA